MNELILFRERSVEYLFTNSTFGDVAITVDGLFGEEPKVFYCNRGIVAAHSTQLDKLLYDDDGKKQEQEQEEEATKLSTNTNTNTNAPVTEIENETEPLDSLSSLDPSDNNSNTIDVDTKTLKLCNISQVAFKWFLKVVYGFNPPLTADNVVLVLHFASRYDIHPVTHVCLENITEQINKRNENYNLVEIIKLMLRLGMQVLVPYVLRGLNQLTKEKCIDILLSDLYLRIGESTIDLWFFQILKFDKIISNENLYLAIQHWFKYSTAAFEKKINLFNQMKNSQLIKYVNFENMDLEFYQNCVNIFVLNKNDLEKMIKRQENAKNNDISASTNKSMVQRLNLVNFEISMLDRWIMGCSKESYGETGREIEIIGKQIYCCCHIGDLLKITPMQPSEVFEQTCSKIIQTKILPQLLQFLNVQDEDDNDKNNEKEVDSSGRGVYEYRIELQYQAASIISSLGMLYGYTVPSRISVVLLMCRFS